MRENSPIEFDGLRARIQPRQHHSPLGQQKFKLVTGAAEANLPLDATVTLMV
jgi:hypothetical protein